MIRLIKSTFYNEADTKRRLIEFLADAQTLSMGAKCREYEEAFAAKIGHEDCVLVNSGSSANLALIQALMNLGRLKPGDRVGFSATTWATNVMPLITLGLRPVPVDIELDTLNVSSRTLNAVLDQQPLDALFITNLLGFCDDLDVIAARCKADGMGLIEDN
ncbi:MAG: DegT/DnrJ/EryC1/StrS family aminotransferase, partial [Candidatus Poribacteria bacterium]|nr:DegT/DnrJ/EryC1/StrS family aminotransferase [Candidatus Poribacteria bacterium]